MNSYDWDALGELARKIGARAGDSEAASFLNLFRLLLTVEALRQQEAHSAELSTQVVVELRDSGPKFGSINFSAPVSNELLFELAFHLREQTSKKPGETSFPFIALTPEIREWALRQPLHEEEIVAELRDVREKGGPELTEIIHQLEMEQHNCELTHS